MFARRTDLEIERDALARFLPWTIAFMVFLACLALAGAFTVERATQRWDAEASGTITVQIAPAEGATAPAADDPRVRWALEILRETPGVESAVVIADAQVTALLEPWLGAGWQAADLPLPRLIDVRLAEARGVDLAALGERLSGAVPGVTIDDHRRWLDRLARLADAIGLLAVLVLTFITAATVGTVIFTTRAGMAVHRDAIEVLHLIGAQDSYVARQFAGRALALGFKGGLLGLALAAPTLLALGWLARRLEGGLLPDFSLGPIHWGLLAALPLMAGMVAMFTARQTVLRALRRLP